MQNLCRPRLIETVLRRRPSGRFQSAAGVPPIELQLIAEPIVKHLIVDSKFGRSRDSVGNED